MFIRQALIAAGVAALLTTAAAPASAKTFRFAFQGNYQSADPYALNETFTLGLHAAVYEGLIKRGKDLAIVPGLAERWETVDAALALLLAQGRDIPRRVGFHR